VKREDIQSYLSFARTNDNVYGSEQLSQGTDEQASETSALIQDNLNDLSQGVKADQATDMKDIAHHAQDAIVLDLRAGQPPTCPVHYVVGQRAKQHQHVLRLKALLRALGEAQSLLVAFQRSFYAPPR